MRRADAGLSSFHSLDALKDAMEASQEQSDPPRVSASAAPSATAPSALSSASSSSRPPRHVGESAMPTTGDPVPTGATTSEQLPAASPTPEDLARQLAGFTVAAQQPPTATATATATAPRRVEPHTQMQEQPEQEEEWLLKEIHWPPLPPTPAAASAPPPTTSLGPQVQGSATASSGPGFSTDPALKVKIICQNENGPCSLIALCTSALPFRLESPSPDLAHAVGIVQATSSSCATTYTSPLAANPSPTRTSRTSSPTTFSRYPPPPPPPPPLPQCRSRPSFPSCPKLATA